ncbi:hypothetical protein HYC85_014282 [Camellia sinensis]|uniref:AAA+ ATPase domain-containing protein n=1 Tax=Camellia sinensis TaxID=4442 RepID=A0A7J7H727_CAMSI|nr:hypothetical protein HYC85_014282 [Camellia sinensis]
MFGWGDIVKILCSDGVIKACKTGWSHVGYVIHYKENIRKLEDELVGLEDEWRRIDGSAHRARDNAGVVENDVWQWLMSAYGMKAEVEVFQPDMVRENKSCFKCLCPNIYWRYLLGKESKKKTARVIILKEEGAKFMTCPVSHRAPLPDAGFTFSANYEAFYSRKHIFEEIIRSLKDPSIKMIGIYGPGGVGKTTMVEEVRQLAKRNGLFHSVAMTIVSKVVEKEKVQGELASQLGLKLDEYGRAGQLLNRLRNGQKNLVILDDVWEPLDLADIGIPTTDGGNNEPLNLPDIGIPFTTGSDMGCKVVITTRKQRLCQMMQKSSELKNFPIDVLTKTEAWSLFTKVAEISVDSEIPSEAKEVCDKCGGLPVAIRAVAAALKGKGKHAWKDALRQLKNYKIKEIADIDQNLLIPLKWSYDRLEPKDARSCFLLCSLFPEDTEISIDELVRYSIGMRLLDQNLNIFDEVRDRVLAMVDVLKTSCLLLDGMFKDVVRMHDIIRDVAISIAEDEKRYLVKNGIEKWPEKVRYESYLAISLRFTANIHKFPNELECRGLHTLVLKCSNDSPTDFPNNFFNGMENNLEVLDLSEMPIKSLPSSLPTLVKLRMLCLNGRRLITDIALLGSLRNLEILRLTGMKKVLFHNEDGTGFSELQFLKSQPQIPPGSFGNLCELRVGNCQFKFLFTHSIARGLERLQCLQIEGCKDMEEIIRNERQGDEEEIIFHHLKKMVLWDLPKLRSFFSSMKNTSTTEANNSNPSRPFFCEKVAFPALEYLKISYAKNISGIIGDKRLKLPIQQEENESLWQLRNLPRLRDLRIRRCFKLKAIVVANKEGWTHNKRLVFPELRSLKLFGLGNLKSIYDNCGPEGEEEKEILEPQPLFNEKVAFPVLEDLTIRYVTNISGIIGDKQLKLPVQQEENESFWQLRNLPRLRHLLMVECSKLKAIVVVNKKGGAHNKPLIFRELRSLVLSSLPNLKSFYGICGSKAEEEEEILEPQPFFNEKVVFPCLEELTIWGLNNFKQMWISTPPTNSFNKLTSLSVGWCEELLYVAPSELLGSLQNLQSLEIKNCESIEEVFKTRGSNAGEGIVSRDEATSEQVEIIPVPPHLERVSFEDLPHLIGFCSGYKSPPSVQLSIKECPSFRPLM